MSDAPGPSLTFSPSDAFRRENVFNWDTEHPSMDEALLAGGASYQAFNRYLSGTDLFLLPRSRRELESIL